MRGDWAPGRMRAFTNEGRLRLATVARARTGFLTGEVKKTKNSLHALSLFLCQSQCMCVAVALNGVSGYTFTQTLVHIA